MKYLLLILIVGVVLWLMRSRRRVQPPPAAQPKPQQRGTVPLEMVACAHCGLNLPRGEAVQDGSSTRSYCSEAHRAAGPR